jgi:RHS repeat-associated protein
MTTNGGASYTYDAENHLVLMGSTSGYAYFYDGDGNRVKKCTSTVAFTCQTSPTRTLYWRGGGGDPLIESTLGGTNQEEYIFFNGKRIARRDVSNSAVHYYFSDHLGSTSMTTDANGTMSACPTNSNLITGEDESDYYPYGGEQPLCNRVPQNYKFTGKERDSESGLDNFGARFDASSLGRFMSPDMILGHLADPESLNRYAYVRNSPTVFVDPTGLDGEWCQGVRAENQALDEAVHGWQNDELNRAADLWASNMHELFVANYWAAEDASSAQNPQGSSCGFFCRLFHRDHVPARFVILNDKTENKGSYSIFYYQLENKEGQKLTGNGYAVEEHISPSPGTTTSEGTFVPATHGVSQDLVGEAGQDAHGQPQSITLPTSPDADFIVEQTFTVQYQGNEYNLTTKFEHETHIVNGVATNTVIPIDQ